MTDWENNITKKQQGGILIQVLAFMTIGTLILSGFVQWGLLSLRIARHSEDREQAIQVAEAGVDYYRWHLAHAPTDFQDGTATSGPYVHDYYDKQGVKIGTYTLSITPPLLGSSLVTVVSVGRVLDDPTIARTLQVRFAKPSFAKYAVVSNSDMSIGANILGPMHSNGGILFVTGSGAAHDVVTSALNTFRSTTTGWVTKWAVTDDSIDPNPPTAFTPVTATFLAGRRVNDPALSFGGITADLSDLLTKSQPAQGGLHYNASGALGYHIVLKTNDTFDIYTVNTAATQAGCSGFEWWTTPSCPVVANSFWSIGTQTLLAGNVPFPTNGIIYCDDHVWVNGQINTARLTIVAATLPIVGSGKNILVNSNLLYTNYDGQDVIGLIAQGSFLIGLKSTNDVRVDAAIIAQNGRVSRMGYKGTCGGDNTQGNLYLYGMFASNQRYAYGNLGAGCAPGVTLNGFQTSRTYEYDSHLLYEPPPSFPQTTSQYQVISWDEI